MDNEKNIKIPIKKIVENSAKNFGCDFNYDDMMYIRRFFIACLNLGFLEPEDLKEKCDALCSRIKSIVQSSKKSVSTINKTFKIDKDVLYIQRAYAMNATEELITIGYFKAFLYVLLGCEGKLPSFEETLCSLAAEKIYVMDVKGERIVMPKSENECIVDKDGNPYQITLRSGHRQFNFPISMLKMFFIAAGYNENQVILDMIHSSFNEQFNSLIDSKQNIEAIKKFNELFVMYISRKINEPSTKEFEKIKEYSLFLVNRFDDVNQNCLAFMALIPDDDIRELAIEKVAKLIDD